MNCAANVSLNNMENIKLLGDKDSTWENINCELALNEASEAHT